MRTYILLMRRLGLLLLVLLLLSACGGTQGTIPRGIPDRGNGTPAVAGAKNSNSVYAFVRNNQLLLSTNGQDLTPVTNFTYGNQVLAVWQAPAWAPGNRSIAFVMSAYPPGIGGGGCPGPDYNQGNLYVLDVASRQILRVGFTGSERASNNDVGIGKWKDVFWEDATHLLGWYTGGGTGAATSAAPGLYRYDLTTQKTQSVLSLSNLGGQSTASGNSGPQILSVRYANGQLFYERVDQPNTAQSQIALYSHSLLHPEQQSTKVLDVGTEGWCNISIDGTSTPAPYVFPGWDVSRDGGQVAVQMLNGKVQVLNLQSKATTDVFTQVPAQVLGQDIRVSWSPNNQALVLYQQNGVQQPAGPYAISLAHPEELRQYTPNSGGNISWRADSGAFALQKGDPFAQTSNAPPDVYSFRLDTDQGQVLVADASSFSWGR